MIDIRSDANTWEPKPIIPMIETASLVRNEVMIPKDSSFDVFTAHLINLKRLYDQMYDHVKAKYPERTI